MAEPIEIIQIKPMSLNRQKMSSSGALRLELYKDCLKYYCNFEADEPVDKEDESLGWKSVRNIFEITVHKNACVGFEKTYIAKFEESNYWAVYIYVSGMADDIKMFFRKHGEAQEMCNKLHNYFYGNNG